MGTWEACGFTRATAEWSNAGFNPWRAAWCRDEGTTPSHPASTAFKGRWHNQAVA